MGVIASGGMHPKDQVTAWGRVEPGETSGAERVRDATPGGRGGDNTVTVRFSEVLEEKMRDAGLCLSGHARKRLESTGRDMSEEEIRTLAQGIGLAKTKGCKGSLVLMQDMALIVDIKRSTVVTAIHQDRLKENIFTNIDSAIIVK